MSFSTDFKQEILNNELKTKAERLAFISAVIRQIGSIHISRNVINFEIESESSELINKCVEVIKSLYDIEIAITFHPVENSSKFVKNYYQLTLPAVATKQIATDTNLIEYIGDMAVGFSDGVGFEFNSSEEIKAYLLGIAVTSVSITIPVPSESDSRVYVGSYSLEMRFNNESLTYDIMSYFAEFDIFLKKVKRGEEVYGLYIRDSEMISDFMAYFGGSNAVLELNNIIVSRSVRNKTNRERNCVIANIDKSVMAGQKQYLAIKAIDEKIGLDKLSDKLRELAKIRLDNPDLTLDQIAELVGGGISKSGINHRFRKIMEIANSLNK